MARILIADDDSEIRITLQKLLQMVGHEVELAKDGLEAVRILDSETFDLMVTDIVMPNQEGLESIMQARQKHPDLHLIAMSGGGKGRTENYLRMAKSFGAEAIFKKPFSPREMLDKVNELVTS
ncbi:MAG: response regulator [Planctomycetota bacterium]|jgi:DNA-binding response OmpR family regulator|nr:response regulator [Planctomycetota bacterium]